MSTFGIRISSLLLAAVSCFGADADLKALYDGHHWFELREALRQQKGTALYRGAVAAAFQQTEEAERELNPLGTAEARGILGAIHLRSGLYSKAAAMGISAIAQLPDQIVVARKPSRIRGEIRNTALYAPVTVNRHNGNALIDSDMNMSMVCESEAHRIGLKVLTAIGISGVTGESKEGGRLAVADQFEIGELRLRNIAFVVISDEQEPCKHWPPSERLVVGLPVILAMQRLRWQHDGTIDIGGEAARLNAHPNLDIDSTDPVTRIDFQGRKLEMVLDMGSNTTQFWPPFAREFASIVAKGAKQSTTLNGISGSSEVESVELPDFQFQITGSRVAMSRVDVLTQTTTADSDRRHGRLGFNVLQRGAALDFRAMTLRVERYQR
jgi:hypothetical protein